MIKIIKIQLIAIICLGTVLVADSVEVTDVLFGKDASVNTKDKNVSNIKHISIDDIEDNVTLEDENISKIFLSFEEEKRIKELEEEKRKQEEAEAKKIAEEAEAKRKEKKKLIKNPNPPLISSSSKPMVRAKNAPLFPSLESQLLAFENKLEKNGAFSNNISDKASDVNDTQDTMEMNLPIEVVYGVFCDGVLGCYAIGENIIYRVGNTINGMTVKHIDAKKITFENNVKMWFSR